jgi:hypothetical protein
LIPQHLVPQLKRYRLDGECRVPFCPKLQTDLPYEPVFGVKTRVELYDPRFMRRENPLVFLFKAAKQIRK